MTVIWLIAIWFELSFLAALYIGPALARNNQ